MIESGVVDVEYYDVIIEFIEEFGLYYIFMLGMVMFYVCLEVGVKCDVFLLIILIELVVFLDGKEVLVLLVFVVISLVIYIFVVIF